MRIAVDIGHPAHVHFFKNFIWEMRERGHTILITASDKEVSLKLLNNYGFNYVDMGSYGKSAINKMLNVPLMALKMYKKVNNFKPDIFVGISAIRAAYASKLTRKPCIVFDDTEHSKWEHILYAPCADAICTPSCFRKNFSKKQIRYDGYHELAYLHPNYFRPDPSVPGELGLKRDDKFVVLRFVAWQASHDIGQHGFNMEAKRKLVKELEKHARVLITSENSVPEELEEYRITLPPQKIHDLLYYATMYIGEGATMATEAAILGTPSIYVSSLWDSMGNFHELEERYSLILNFKEPGAAINKVTDLLKQQNVKQEWTEKRQKLLSDKIDVTQFMVEFVDSYPESLRKMKEGGSSAIGIGKTEAK